MDLNPEDMFDNPDDLALVKQMLRADVEFEHLHVNSLSIQAGMSNQFVYFDGEQPGHRGSYFSRTVYPRNIKGQLQALGFVAPDRRPEAPSDKVAFTEVAKDWYRQQAQHASAVSDGDIQRAIGELLYARRGRESDPTGVIDLDLLASRLNVSLSRIEEQIANLLELGFIRHGYTRNVGGGRWGQVGPGDLVLSEQKGLLWALRKHPSIEQFDTPALSVKVDFSDSLKQFLAELYAVDADPETKQEVAEIAVDLQDNPTIEKESRFMELGANTYTLAVPVIRFISENGDKLLKALEQMPPM